MPRSREPFHLQPAYKIKYVKKKKKLQEKLEVQLLEDFKRLFETGENSDLIICSCDHQNLHAHRAILLARYPCLLENSSGSKSDDITTIQSTFDANTIKNLLLQIYTMESIEPPTCQSAPIITNGHEANNHVTDNIDEYVTPADLSFEEMERLCRQNSDSMNLVNHEEDNLEASISIAESEGTSVSYGNQSSGSVQNSSAFSENIISGFYSELSDLDACCQLGQDLVNLYINGVQTDLTLKLGDNEYKVHRVVLMSRCPYFNIMLGGNWRESGSNVVTIEKMKPVSLQQAILYMYGGVVDLAEGCSAFDMAKMADMLGLSELSDIASFHIQKNYCHFFHKPICQDCIAGICEVLPLISSLNIVDLKSQCISWLCRNFVKVWPSKMFLLLPQEILEEVKTAKIDELRSTKDILKMLESALYCKNIYTNTSIAIWTDNARDMVRSVYENCIQYYSDNYGDTLSTLLTYVQAGKIADWSLLQWEDVLSVAVDFMTPEQGVTSYVALGKLVDESKVIAKDSQFTNMMSNLLEKCEIFVSVNMNKVCHSSTWISLDPLLQAKLTERAVFVTLPFGNQRPQRVPSPIGTKPKKLTVREIMAKSPLTVSPKTPRPPSPHIPDKLALQQPKKKVVSYLKANNLLGTSKNISRSSPNVDKFNGVVNGNEDSVSRVSKMELPKVSALLTKNIGSKAYSDLEIKCFTKDKHKGIMRIDRLKSNEKPLENTKESLQITSAVEVVECNSHEASDNNISDCFQNIPVVFEIERDAAMLHSDISILPIFDVCVHINT